MAHTTNENHSTFVLFVCPFFFCCSVVGANKNKMEMQKLLRFDGDRRPQIIQKEKCEFVEKRLCSLIDSD